MRNWQILFLKFTQLALTRKSVSACVWLYVCMCMATRSPACLLAHPFEQSHHNLIAVSAVVFLKKKKILSPTTRDRKYSTPNFKWCAQWIFIASSQLVWTHYHFGNGFSRFPLHTTHGLNTNKHLPRSLCVPFHQNCNIEVVVFLWME